MKWAKDFINKIVCGDAVEVMKKIPDGAVDLVITSPPYNIKNSTGNGLKDGRGGKWANAALQKGYANYDDCMPHEEYVKWQRESLKEMVRIISDAGAVFVSGSDFTMCGIKSSKGNEGYVKCVEAGFKVGKDSFSVLTGSKAASTRRVG